MSQRSRRRSGAPRRSDARQSAGQRAQGGAPRPGGAPGRPRDKISFAAQVGLLGAVFAAGVGLAELFGAANLGVAFGVAVILFAVVLVALLLRA